MHLIIFITFIYHNCNITGYIHNFIVTFRVALSFGILRSGSLRSRDCFIGRRTARTQDVAFNTNRDAGNEYAQRMVSHELCAPLFAIKGTASTVLKASRVLDRTEVRRFFRIIEEQPGDDANNPTYILTEPRVGYRMDRPDDAPESTSGYK